MDVGAEPNAQGRGWASKGSLLPGESKQTPPGMDVTETMGMCHHSNPLKGHSRS